MYVMFFNFIEKYWQNQFPTTILWSSLVILDHLVYFGIIWNLDIFLETFGYFWDILEICWRSIIRVSSVIISYIQQICTILTFQYLTKAAFSCLQSKKVTFFHFALFFRSSVSRCVSLLCLPVVSHRFWVEVLGPAFPLKNEDLWNWRGWQWTLGAFELYKFGSA